jgi:hypothetical protein
MYALFLSAVQQDRQTRRVAHPEGCGSDSRLSVTTTPLQGVPPCRSTDRAAFSNELAEAITKLVSKYHDESAPGGRGHRLVAVAHPLSQKSESKEPT